MVDFTAFEILYLIDQCFRSFSCMSANADQNKKSQKKKNTGKKQQKKTHRREKAGLLVSPRG